MTRRNISAILIALLAIYDVGFLHFYVRANLLTSVMLVLAFAIAGFAAGLLRVSHHRRSNAGQLRIPSHSILEPPSPTAQLVPRILSSQLHLRINHHRISLLTLCVASYDVLLIYLGLEMDFLSGAALVLVSAAGGALAWRVRAILFRVITKRFAVDALVLTALAASCFYLYAGFTDIFYPITQDHTHAYAGTRYVVAHPSFTFVAGYTHPFPLLAPYFYVVQSLTRDTQSMNIIPSFLIHILNAFLIYRISRLLSGGRNVIPALVAAFIFLAIGGPFQSLLVFPHVGPILTAFFALCSLYLFLKVNRGPVDYRRSQLYFSFALCLISIGFGSHFVALPVIYGLAMAARFRRFRRDVLWAMAVLGVGVGLIFLLSNLFRVQYGIGDAGSRGWFSVSSFVQRIGDYPYSFSYTLTLFFPWVTAALATLFYDSFAVLRDAGAFQSKFSWHFSLLILSVPLAFCEKRKAMALYALVAGMFFLWVPFVFAPTSGWNQRHFSQSIVVSAVFLGLLAHYMFEAIVKIRPSGVRTALNWLLVLFWAILTVRIVMVSRNEIGRFVRDQSAASASIERFIEEFKKVRVQDRKKQIYLLTNRIPERASIIGIPGENCYYFYYLAAKFKDLPVDLYREVYMDLETRRPLKQERFMNCFLRLEDGSAFGFFTDRARLVKVLQDYPDIRRDDVIVLTWQEALKQGKLPEG
ncbi:MAG: hypothetical protein HY315_06875 [Acidobacteria bacterium]|nr:hypothetical protein [Acidobacteriota bacterium]